MVSTGKKNYTFLDDISKICHILEKSSKASILYRKGQVVFYEDTRPMGVYFIKKGRVKTSRINPFGKDNILGVLNSFSFLGYKELLNNEHYNFTATIIEEAEIYYISKEKFCELIEKEEALFNRVINVLRHDLIAV